MSRVACMPSTPHTHLSVWLHTHWRWWEHKVVWENSSSALRLPFPPAFILCGLGEREMLWGGEPGPQAPSPPGPTPFKQVLPCTLPCPVPFIPSSVLSPRPPSAMPTHLGPPAGSQTGPCRSQAGRLRGSQSSETNSPPQISQWLPSPSA